MKKTLIIGILLAIASMTTVFASDWKVVTLPFEQQNTNVNVILPLPDGYIAFGDHEAIRGYFDSLTTAKVDYEDPTFHNPNKPNRRIRGAYKTFDEKLVIFGDENFVACSADSGKTWRGFNNYTEDGSWPEIKMVISDTYFYYLINANQTSLAIRKSNTLRRNPIDWFDVNGNKKTNIPVNPITGLETKNGAIMFFAEDDNTTGSKCSWYFITIGTGIIASEKQIPGGGMVVSAFVDKDSTANMLVFNPNGSYSLYKTDGEKITDEKTFTGLTDNDVMFPKGYVDFEKQVFFGKNNQSCFAIDTKGNRNDVNIVSPTCFANKNDTLIIGGTNGQIAINNFVITETHSPTVETISITKQGNMILIDAQESVSWKLISLSGKLIAIGTNNEICVNVPKGMYLVEVKTTKEKSIQKIIF